MKVRNQNQNSSCGNWLWTITPFICFDLFVCMSLMNFNFSKCSDCSLKLETGGITVREINHWESVWKKINKSWERNVFSLVGSPPSSEVYSDLTLWAISIIIWSFSRVTKYCVWVWKVQVKDKRTKPSTCLCLAVAWPMMEVGPSQQ